MKTFKNIGVEQIRNNITSYKATIMKQYGCNKYFPINLEQSQNENNAMVMNASSREEVLKSLMNYDCSLSDEINIHESNNNLASAYDQMNSSEFYSLVHMNKLIFSNNIDNSAHMFKSVTLERMADRDEIGKAISILSVSFIKSINNHIKENSNAYISINLNGADHGLTSTTSNDTSNINIQNQMKYNYFTPITTQKSVDAYAQTIEKLISMIFYFINDDIPQSVKDNVPQMDYLNDEIIDLKTQLDALKRDLDNDRLINAAIESLRVLMYKILTTKFKPTDPYTKSILHFFYFAMHLQELNDSVYVCGKISYLKKISAHLLFVLKGTVFWKQIEIDSERIQSSDNPLYWLRCVSAETLTQFNMVVNIFKLADAFSINELSEENSMYVLFDDDNVTRIGVSINGQKLMHSNFLEGNSILLQDLMNQMNELLINFPIGQRDNIFAKFKDDHREMVIMFNNKVYITIILQCLIHSF